MSSQHLRGDTNYAWPTAEVAVMGAKVFLLSIYALQLTLDLADPNFKKLIFISTVHNELIFFLRYNSK